MTNHEAGRAEDEAKPEQLLFPTYLQLLRNSVGTAMFRNFYVRTDDRGEFDALADGDNSCAFYVSGVLVMFGKLPKLQGTVASTVRNLQESGWRQVQEESAIQPGDVIVWEPQVFADGVNAHIGFALGEGQAVSTSWTKKAVVQHDLHLGADQRAITDIYRLDDWG